MSKKQFIKLNQASPILEERRKAASLLSKAERAKERADAESGEKMQIISRREQELDLREKELELKRADLDAEILAVRDFIHEQRKFNERMSQSVEELRKSIGTIKEHPYDGPAQALILNMGKSIIALSSLSSMRMELLEFNISPRVFASMPPKQIFIWREFEKIYKSINNGVDSVRDKFRMLGQSVASVEAPRILTIAIFIILENAWKYSPSDEQVFIQFQETQGKTLVKVSNVGPYILPEEKEKLTERSYRGKNAVKTPKITGKGLGLGIAKQIFNLCMVGFSLDVDSTPTRKISGIEYAPFTVDLVFHT